MRKSLAGRAAGTRSELACAMEARWALDFGPTNDAPGVSRRSPVVAREAGETNPWPIRTSSRRSPPHARPATVRPSSRAPWSHMPLSAIGWAASWRVGAWGSIHEAEDLRLLRTVAIKQLLVRGA